MLKNDFKFIARISVILIIMVIFSQFPVDARFATIANQDGIAYLPLIPNGVSVGSGFGSVSGTVRDAHTAVPLADATICYGVSNCVMTNSQGQYSLMSVPVGRYDFIGNVAGYVEGIEKADVKAGSTTIVDFDMLPLLDEGEIRVIVTWDSTPSWPPDNRPNDLNLHMWTPFSPPDHHIYKGYKGNCSDLGIEPFSCYEVDEFYGSGPDAIIVANTGYIYQFAVLNYYDGYPGVPLIDQLDAHVQVFDFTGVIGDFYVETASGEGDLWYVFDLSFGDIEPQNCLVQYVHPGDVPPQSCVDR